MLKWTGHQKGMQGIPGIPARDLSDEEVKRFGKETLLATGLYEEESKKAIKGILEDKVVRPAEDKGDSE